MKTTYFLLAVLIIETLCIFYILRSRIVSKIKTIETRIQILSERKQNTFLEDEPNAWYTQKKLVIAHGGGGQMYSSYLNSKESISSAIKTGAKVIEIDVCLTNDNIPVLSHRFEPDGEIMFFETPSVKEFLETPLPNSNTSLTLESMLSEFKDFDGYFLVDCAFGAEKFVSEWLVKNLSEKQRHHIVFQVHEINFLKSLTERKVFEFLHYNADIKTLEQISPILIACNVHSVSVDDHEIKDLRTLSKLNKSGIHVYAYTVNHKRRFDFLMNAGASGIFSDRLFYKENVQ